MKGSFMKDKYLDILIVNENGYKIQIRKCSLYFIVKVGRENMNNYQKKAHSSRCYSKEELNTHLQQICSLHSINFTNLQNKLNKAIEPKKQVKVLPFANSMVDNGGIPKNLESRAKNKTFKVVDDLQN